MDLSIIIPAYNRAKTISRTLDSILGQCVRESYEIVVVDDHSSDDTYRILQDYAERCPQVKVVRHDENMKVSKARATGYRHATGRYIWNIDADDELTDDALSYVLAQIKRHDPDILIVNALQIRNGTKRHQFLNSRRYKNIILCFEGMIWMKIVRRSIITEKYELFQHNFNMGDDYLYSMELLSCLKTLVVSKKVCYLYHRDIDDSLTRTQTNMGMAVSYHDFLLDACYRLLARIQDQEIREYYIEDLKMTSLQKRRILERGQVMPEHSDLLSGIIQKSNKIIKLSTHNTTSISDAHSWVSVIGNRWKIYQCKLKKKHQSVRIMQHLRITFI